MNEHQQQRDRAGTVYYDAQPNFGTPPNRVESSGDNYKITMRKESVGSHRDPDEVLYESVHTERRHHHSGYTPSRDRRSPLNSTPVRMAPMTSSYDSSAPPSAFRVHAGADSQIHNQMAGSRWAPQQHEEFKPGPRTSSAANIDARFGRSSRIGVQQYPETGTNMVFSRRNAEPIHQQQKDFSVVGAYASEQHLYGGPNSRHGSVRQHSNEYELDPRLNVTYPQFYVDDWKERHRPRDASAAAAGYTPRAPRPSPSFNSSSPAHPPPRPRFASDANSRHLYEEVPMAATAAASPPHNGYRSPAYGRSNLTATASKETAILDDYDNVPNEFIEGLAQKKTKDDRESNMDGESAIYQPGRYQPC
uniref:Uncharacterized protein n=1 Tax=Caenorhabditis japonica TaxID=281687 RepID=A0A8R1HMM0_CAEJA